MAQHGGLRDLKSARDFGNPEEGHVTSSEEDRDSSCLRKVPETCRTAGFWQLNLSEQEEKLRLPKAQWLDRVHVDSLPRRPLCSGHCLGHIVHTGLSSFLTLSRLCNSPLACRNPQESCLHLGTASHPT